MEIKKSSDWVDDFCSVIYYDGNRSVHVFPRTITIIDGEKCRSFNFDIFVQTLILKKWMFQEKGHFDSWRKVNVLLEKTFCGIQPKKFDEFSNFEKLYNNCRKQRVDWERKGKWKTWKDKNNEIWGEIQELKQSFSFSEI